MNEVLVINFNSKAIVNSEGVQDEIKYAKKHNKPVKYLKIDISFSFNLSNIK